ncbi:MAG TPA: bifunctional metallophosphatase/5'-nucleotidase [Gaiellaceae bacterium]|nr:bifunctional metallophosphatase/5'-nucleotidase [Gaiellaceae bacterium]
MRRWTAVAALVAAFALVGAAPSLADPGPKKEKLTHVRLLAFNDFHGHLEAGTPGTLVNPATGTAVPAGGAEYFSTHMKMLGSNDVDTYVVSAGDMIGASPLLSGLFHDEPTIEVMNQIGVDVHGVGNHEFDEGKAELLRMQYGNQLGGDGCHPVDGCQDGTPFYGSVFQFLAANVIDTSTNNPLLPPYKIVNTSEGEKIAFVGETLEGTPLIVTPTGVAGLEFLDEADTVNRLVPILKQRQVGTIVLLLHQGGQQNAPFSKGFMDINACENFTGPDVLDVVDRLSPEVDLVVSAHTHQPYVCTFDGRLVTSASSFGRAITKIDLTIDRRTGDLVDATAVNNVVTQNVEKDPAITSILAHYKTFSDPIANRVIGSITADIYSARGTVNGTNRAGEQPMGDVIADGMLEATSPSDFGGAVAAFMNVGGVRASLLYDQISGGELPGEVTYAEAFTVQPFGNTLVVKTCTGQQLYDVLEQQFENPAAGQQRVMAVSGLTYSYTRVVPAGQRRVTDGSLKIGGVVVDKAASYRVAMNNFIADGGDGFSVFTTCTNPLGGEVDIDAFARYLGAHSPVSPPPLDRITRLD